MRMAAGRWDMTKAQMSWIMNDPGENPFVIKQTQKKERCLTMKASDIIKAYYGKAET